MPLNSPKESVETPHYRPGTYLLYTFNKAGFEQIKPELSGDDWIPHDPAKYNVSHSELLDSVHGERVVVWMHSSHYRESGASKILEKMSPEKTGEMEFLSGLNTGVSMVLDKQGNWTSHWKTERQEFTNETQKAPQSILREEIANLKYPTSIKNIALSELVGETQELANSIKLMINHRYLYLYRDDITDPEHTHAKLQIGRFALDEEGNITDFVPDTDDNLVRQTMSMLDHIPFFNELKNRFIIENLDAEDLRSVRGRIAQALDLDKEKRRCEVTNESLEAIIESLNPNQSDRVLSVCGTGDVPLAFLERGCSVDAVDLDPAKIALAKEHLSLLETGKWCHFLAADIEGFEKESMNRRLYFMRDLKPKASTLAFFREQTKNITEIDEPELKRISLACDWKKLNHSQSKILKEIVGNKGNINFQTISILEALDGKKYTKVWLSNIIGYKEQDFEFFRELILKLTKGLEKGGEFYTTNGYLTEKYLNRAYDEGIIARGTFMIDKKKTELARKLQDEDLQRVEHQYSWLPSVYVKT